MVNWYGLQNNNPSATRFAMVAGIFAFQPCLGEWKTIYNAPPISTPLGQQNVFVWTPITATTEFMRLAEVNLPAWSIEPDVNPPPPDDVFRFPRFNGAPIVLLEKTPGRYFMHIDRTVLNVTSPLGPRDAFFYIDATRTFFVEKRFRLVTSWIDAGGAYPNMLARIARDATRGLDSALIDWGNKAVLDMNSEYTIEEQYRFHTFYHPYACEFIRRVGRDGIDGLLRWSSGAETPVQNLEKLDVDADYEPTKYVYEPFPIENVDFSYGGTYSQYNWELFFHAPFMMATRLSKNGRYDEADKWYRYIFDPTGGAPGDGPERFWNVRPFRENINLASIQEQLAELSANNPQAEELVALLGLGFDADGGTTLAAQIAQWRENPFNPHLIARMRPVAYQKAVVMKYVQNLLAWGDSLFRRDTMESINEATQLYILASHILGKRPRVVETNDVDARTYAQLETASADENALLQLEVIVPEPRNTVVCCSDRQPAPTWHLPYFCVPHNENMLALWDTVEDRLLKVRCCMNIDGVVRQLPLFEAPLDPGLLVKAAAAGLDLGEVLADVFVPLPKYRFSVLLPKAVEFAGSVAAMGNALLSALEKRDGEALSKLRSTQEIDMLTRVRDVKRRQIEEARETLEGLRRSREVIDERRLYYTNIEDRIPQEQEQRTLTIEATNHARTAQTLQLMASVYRLIPQFILGVTQASTEFGGVQLGGIVDAIAQGFSIEASASGARASMAGTEAGYQRRADDWDLQKRLAERELTQIDRQIAAAEIRLDIAQKELQNHDQSLKNAKEVDDYLRTKYTREELYEWFITKVKEIYFQAYKVAYDMAKRAQKAFQFELALPNETYLQPAYWDKTTDGLLAGERLQHDLRRMDAAYLELNKREFEITKHVSLAEIAPLALLKLREHETVHSCDVNLEEWMFDQDWPGHYLRRIKSVSMSIPVVSGTYASVNSKLALVTNTVRMNESLEGGYARTGTSDTRFADNRVLAQSIVTSSAQQDGGMFELVFRDERYLPFEGAGVEGLWRISLDPKTNRFRLSDAKDVILHIRYMARESGVAQFQTKAEEALELNNGPKGYRLFSAKTDFPGEWAAFTTGGDDPNSQKLDLPFALDHFQPIRGSRDLKITAIHVFAKWRDSSIAGAPMTVYLDRPSSPDATLDLSVPLDSTGDEYGKLIHEDVDTSASVVKIRDASDDDFTNWVLKVKSTSNAPTNALVVGGWKLKPDALEDFWIVCTYQRI